ncbi:pentatricopeptide repeat-containing protein At5g67570, chloroplastic isoform X2 [Cryptomeria japonica]|uniref:pentatricopeptide repeat-containing protein At5g67570, chloroplastic isoform X2 n=1 Tax=Cryptomeria japonica TaxID=3369 RepID=UPI0025AD216E|nr:pentatricopeptide repeat-containing protein At5g67570, chloroplastic isoform X2 [Cryptomeria japonica]
MSTVASSNPVLFTVWIRNSDFSKRINSSRLSSGKVCCSTINVDAEKIKRLLNVKGSPRNSPPVKRLRRKEISDFRNIESKTRDNAKLDFSAEDSPFEAAFEDYIKVMDDVRRSREVNKSGEEEQHKELIAEKNVNLYKKSEQKETGVYGSARLEAKSEGISLKAKRKQKTELVDFQSRARFKELNMKTLKKMNGKMTDTVSDEDFSMKPGFRVSRDNMRELVKDSLDLNAKVGLMAKAERGVKTGEVGRELKKNAMVNEVALSKLSEKEYSNSKFEHSHMVGGSKTENKAFQFCAETGPWAKTEERAQRLAEQYIYTTVLSILGKAGRPAEALNMFHIMREEFSTYPDMPAYHSIAVTLGQAGYIKELLDVMDCMQSGPDKKLENVPLRHWNPCLRPDLVIYNALVNACIPHKEWQGAVWVLQQMRHKGIKPNSATYGLIMEVMLKSGKSDLVHEIFGKMERSGVIPNALTYKALVQACWKEDKIDEAVVIIEDMESRGIVGTASVYYEFACYLCSAGRTQEALLQVEKIRRVAKKPLYVTYTGLIKASMDSGHLQDCITIFDHMQKFCAPNIITCNMMLKLYGQHHMFKEATSLFEGIKRGKIWPQKFSDGDPTLIPDITTYIAMLEACMVVQEWDYFENVYQDMLLKGYQLDKRQHSSLIVAASRAGKVHLLKDVYEQLFELGRTPHVSVYKELICQNLQVGDYAKTLTYLSRMAYSKLNIRKSEWIELFEKNSDRIRKNNLQGLLNELSSSSGVYDQTNLFYKTFIKSLQLMNEQWTQ